MSASHRKSAQPHNQSQPYHHYDQSQQYAQHPSYAQYASPPFQHQQGYYQPQQYAPTNPYAFASHIQVSHNSYPQHFHAQSQPYPSSHGLGYQNAIPNAYLQGAYLAASNHPVQGSSSSGHSPGSSTGRPRHKTSGLPSQGTSPSLESQVAHLNLTAPTASLSHEPIAQAAARSARSANALTADAEPRSDISLRYPPLPRLPERCVTPPLLQSSPAAEPESSTLDRSALDYVTSLRSIINAYEKRDDLLRMRTEAVGFQPKQAWAAWQTEPSSGDQPATEQEASSSHEPSNPVLGVRLLQRLDKLQRENDELGELLASGARVNSSSSSAEVEELRTEVEDCHQLIEAMEKALGEAEARATASERALEAACRTNSTAMLPAGATQATGSTGSQQDGKVSGNISKNASPARRGSKPAISNTVGGGKGASQQQQRNAKASGAGKSTRSDKGVDGKTAKTPQPTPAKK